MDVPQARSVRRHTLSVAEIEKIAAEHARGVDARRQVKEITQRWAAGPEQMPDRVDVLYHEGDLEIDGDFRTGVELALALLVVHGDLVVNGLFEDCLDQESVVVVTGDLRARNLISEGWLEVHGDVRVEGCAVFDHNYCTAEIFGGLSAGFIFTRYHHVEVHGQVIASLVAGDAGHIESPHDFAFVEDHDPRLAELLVPKVVLIDGDVAGEHGEDWEFHLDLGAMTDLVRAGRSPLR